MAWRGPAGNVLIGIGDLLVELAGNVNSTSVSSKLQCLFLVGRSSMDIWHTHDVISMG